MSKDVLSMYQASREALIQQERALGHHGLTRTLSTTEFTAVKLIQDLRDHELAAVWGEHGAAGHSMPFTRAQRIIQESSELFKIIKEMPKGAILHCHLDAMNDPFALLRLAFAHPTLAISATAPLTSPTATIAFHTVPLTSPHLQSPATSIYTEAYIPGTILPAAGVRAAFPGGPAAFDDFVVKFITVTPESATWTPAEVWAHFGNTFLIAGGLLRYEPVFEAYIEEVFTLCAKDSVPYLECRINFLDEFIYGKDGELDCPHREWLILFQRAMEAAKSKATTSRPFWGARIIYSTIRFIDPGEGKGNLRWYLEDCLELKREFPDLIAGFDLVGWEDGLRPLADYIEDLLWFKERQKEEGLNIPYLFHAGETLGDGSKADMNLYDAILLDTKRIGHGFSLPQHPLLMDICKNKKIGNLGLSYDFYQVFTASDQMTVLGLGQLGRDSIEASSIYLILLTLI
ncbi:hypothetical protein MNV49_007684 [Pseudohyphozyma bogoriensis]|nr:hypothetical protein MNV49_007684 [Pseudohyphozyma bogoriensis]